MYDNLIPRGFNVDAVPFKIHFILSADLIVSYV